MTLLDIILKACGVVFIVTITFTVVLVVYVCLREWLEQKRNK